MAVLTPEQLQKISEVRSNPEVIKYVDPKKLQLLDSLVLEQRKSLNSVEQRKRTPALLDRGMKMESIQNPVAKSWNLFPMTAGMYKNAPNIPVVPFTPLTGIMDVARDIGVLGKTALEQGLSSSATPFSEKFRRNLSSTASLGSEVGTNLAEKMVEENPNVDPTTLYWSNALTGIGVDATPILTGGSPRALGQHGSAALARFTPNAPKALQPALNFLTKERSLRSPKDVQAMISAHFPSAPTASGPGPFTPWPGIEVVTPVPKNPAHNPWPGIGQPRPETPSVNLPENAVIAGPVEPPYRPPVMGQSDQMELNFGAPLEGRMGPGPEVPAPLNPPAPLPRTSPKWARREAKRTFQGAPKGEQMEFDFTQGPAEDVIPTNAAERTALPKTTGPQEVPPTPRIRPRFGMEKQLEFPFFAEQPIALPDRMSGIRAQMKSDFGEFFAPYVPEEVKAQRAMDAFHGQSKGEQIPFDFTKQASWAQEPAKPVAPPSLRELIAGYTAKGIKPAFAEKLAKQDLGIQDIIPQEGVPSAQPTRAVHPATVPSWERTTQDLFDTMSANLTRKEQEQVSKIMGSADEKFMAGDTEGAVAELESLKGKLDNESFYKLEDILASFKGKKVEIPDEARMMESVADSEELAAQKAALEDMKNEGLDIEKIVEPGEKPKLNPKKMLDDLNDMIGGSEGTSKMSKEAMQRAEIARKAWKEEHIPAIVAVMKDTGKTAAEVIREKFPHLTDEDVITLSKYVKVGNARLGTLPPDLQRVVVENPEVAQQNVVSDAAVRAASKTPGAERAATFLENAKPEDLAAAGSYQVNLAAITRDLMRKDPANAARLKDEMMGYLQSYFKIEHIRGLMLRHGGKPYIDATFINTLMHDLKMGAYTGDDAAAIRDFVERAKKLQPSLLKTLNDGISEYGINMMLYNTDTALRNTIGGLFGVVTNPIERTVQAAMTSVGRMAGKSDAEMQDVTEWGEIIPSVKAGIKAAGPALKRGIKFFVHENPKGVARSYAARAKVIKKQMKAGEITRAEAKAKIRDLARRNKDIGKSFAATQEESSLGFTNERKLRSNNPILDAGGRLVNLGTGAVKSMDVAQSHVLLEMEKAATVARKEIQAIRAGRPVKEMKFTRQDMDRIYKSVLMHTMRQALPADVQKVNRVIGKYAVSNLILPFMRAQLALPRYALQRSPFMLPAAAINVAKSAAGAERLNTGLIARAAMGSVGTFGLYAWLKSKGIKIHSAATDTKEIKLRKLAGKHPGVYVEFSDGRTKRVDDIAPLSFYFSAFAAWDDKERALKEGDAQGVAWAKGMGALARNILSSSVYSSVREIQTAIDDTLNTDNAGARDVYPGQDKGETLDRTPWTRWWNRKVVGVTSPRLLAEAGQKGWLQSADRTYRNPRNLNEEYAAGAGLGFQKNVPEQISVFGEPLTRPKISSPAGTIFTKGNEPSSDPAIRLLESLEWTPSDIPKTIDGIKVSSEKRMAVLKEAGPSVHKIVTRLANSQSFMNKPEPVKLQILKEFVQTAMEPAMEKLKIKMHEEVNRLPEEKKNKLRRNLKDANADVLINWGLY